MRLTRVISAIAIVSMGLGACGGSSDPTGINNQGPPGPPGTSVSVSNNAFSPGTLNVASGKMVTWTWNTCTNDPYGGTNQCVTHSVAFDDGVKSSLQSEGTYSRTFTVKGTYKYHCEVHGPAMSGTITVD